MNRRLKHAAGEPVTFRRDATTIEIASAIRATTNWEKDSPFPGFNINKRSVDWLVTATDLSDDEGTPIEPQEGDSFTTSQGERFEVLRFNPDAPLWKWADEGQSTRRIYTKQLN